MGHVCRSPDKVVRYCQRGHPRKQQLIELFSGEISRILYLKEENTPDAPWTSGVLELFQNAAVA